MAEQDRRLEGSIAAQKGEMDGPVCRQGNKKKTRKQPKTENVEKEESKVEGGRKENNVGRGFRARRQLWHLMETYKQTHQFYIEMDKEKHGIPGVSLCFCGLQCLPEGKLPRKKSELHMCAHVLCLEGTVHALLCIIGLHYESL